MLITDNTPADKPIGSPWTCARNSTNCAKTDLKRWPKYVSAFHYHISRNINPNPFNRYSLESGKWKEINILIFSLRLRSQQCSFSYDLIDIRINDLPYLWSLAWRRHVGVYPDGHHPGGRKPTENTVTEFSTKARIHLSRNS